MAIRRHNWYLLFAANAPVFCDYRQRRLRAFLCALPAKYRSHYCEVAQRIGNLSLLRPIDASAAAVPSKCVDGV